MHTHTHTHFSNKLFSRDNIVFHSHGVTIQFFHLNGAKWPESKNTHLIIEWMNVRFALYRMFRLASPPNAFEAYTSFYSTFTQPINFKWKWKWAKTSLNVPLRKKKNGHWTTFPKCKWFQYNMRSDYRLGKKMELNKTKQKKKLCKKWIR